MSELSEEDVYANDKDPLEAIRELRQAAGSDISEELQADIIENQNTSSEEEDFVDELDTENETETVDEDFPDTSEEDSEENSKTAAQTQEKLKFKANGQEFEFTEQEIKEQFEAVFGKAMDYTQKMQKIAPYRKMISALEAEGVTQEQLNTAIDALKGDKGALQNLLKTNEIDSFDLASEDEDQEYTPTNYGKDETQLAIEEITSKIANDPEYQITVDIVDKQWDPQSRQILASNPGMIQGLHNDVKSGVYDKVAPLAMKMKVLDGNTKSNLEYYVLAGEKFQQQEQSTQSKKTVAELNKQAQDAESTFDQASSEAGRKRAATSTGSRAGRKGVIDYLDDDDEKFNAWYKQLQSNN